MSTKYTCWLASLATFISLIGVSPVRAQPSEVWTPADFKDPAELAATLRDAKSAKPFILNIGSAEQIKGATMIGPVGKSKGMDELKEQLAKLPKDKEIIIYCGCCPFPRCPNAQPGFALLKRSHFTKVKILKLPTNLNEDWISKGYPMEEAHTSGS